MRGRRRHHTRRATATLEFSICLPVLVLLFLGTLDTCANVFLQQTLDVAAYEGSRVAVKPGASTAEVVTRCEDWIKARGIAGAKVQTSPAEIAVVPPGLMVTVTVSAACEETMLFFGPFYKGRRADASFHCVRQTSLP